MTIYTLKETLHDRIKMIETGLDQIGHVVHGSRGETFERGVLEGRLEEARVIFKLVDQVAQDQVTLAQERRDHPLRIVPSMTFTGPVVPDEDLDRHDPNRC
jgi:hypothetical protein